MNNNYYFKIIGVKCLFMLSLILFSCFATYVQFIGRIEVESYSGTIFVTHVYKYNIFAYAAGIIIYFTYLGIAYNKIMRQYTILTRNYNWISRAFYQVVDVFFLGAMFMTQVMIIIFTLGLSCEMRPGYLLPVTYIGWPVVTLLFMGKDIFRKDSDSKGV